MTKGGKRKPGPGKKLGAPTKRDFAKEPTSIRVSPIVLVFLRSTGNASEFIEETIRRTQSFKKWNKDRCDTK